jgi:hypothetical protein
VIEPLDEIGQTGDGLGNHFITVGSKQ